MARKIGADCGAGEENKIAEREVQELEVKERIEKIYWYDPVKADQ